MKSSTGEWKAQRGREVRGENAFSGKEGGIEVTRWDSAVKQWKTRRNERSESQMAGEMIMKYFTNKSRFPPT